MVNVHDKKPRLKDFDKKGDVIIFNQQSTAHFLSIDIKGYWYIAVLADKDEVMQVAKDLQKRSKREEPKSDDMKDAVVSATEVALLFNTKFLFSSLKKFSFALIWSEILVWTFIIRKRTISCN